MNSWLRGPDLAPDKHKVPQGSSPLGYPPRLKSATEMEKNEYRNAGEGEMLGSEESRLTPTLVPKPRVVRDLQRKCASLSL